MLGRVIRLIGKDFLVLRGERIFLFIYIIMTLLGALIARINPWMMLLFGLFPTFTYISYTFNYDYRGAERLFASLPVRRSEIVAARYGGTFVVAFSLLALVYLLNFIEALVLPHLVSLLSYQFAVFYVLLYALFIGVCLPIYFRVGVMKARYVIMILYVLPATLGGAFLGLTGGKATSDLTGRTSLPIDLPVGSSVVIPLVTVLLLALSLPLSVRFFRRRDL